MTLRIPWIETWKVRASKRAIRLILAVIVEATDFLLILLAGVDAEIWTGKADLVSGQDKEVLIVDSLVVNS